MSEPTRTPTKWGHLAVTFDHRSDAYKQGLLEGAAELVALFKDRFALDLFVCYGVLLGFTRAGDFIGHDDDLDLAYISAAVTRQEVRRESEQIVEALVGLGFEAKLSSYGQYRLIRRHKGKRLKFEIFVGWSEEERTRLYFALDEGVAPDLFLPVGVRDFHGVNLPVPHQPEAVLAAIYGNGWRKPNPDFRYDLTPDKWRPFSFLFTTDNQHHWSAYYAAHAPDAPWSLDPSPFAAFVAERAKPCRLLEVGCGNGRDALFFAQTGFEVTGVDYAEPAVELSTARAARLNLAARFKVLNVYDVPQTLAFAKAHAGTFDAVYARFFIHAVRLTGEEGFLRLAASVLKPGGRCYLEFRTSQDLRAQAGKVLGPDEREDGHYRRFLDPDAFIDRAAANGLVPVYQVAGHGMARFGDEDPHVARIILEKAVGE